MSWNGSTCKRQMITPDGARTLLSTIRQNRNLRPGHVKRLQSALREQGSFGPAPIVIDENDELIDGQHRLKAIAESEIPCYCWVIRGARASDRFIVDQGVNRNLRDQLFYAGRSVGSKEAAVLRALCLLIRDSRIGHRYVQLRGQIEHTFFLAVHDAAIEFIRLILSTLSTAGYRLTRSAGTAAIVAAGASEDTEGIIEFCETLRDGHPPSGEIYPRHRTVIALMRTLASTNAHGRAFSETMILYTQRALRAFIDEQELKIIKKSPMVWTGRDWVPEDVIPPPQNPRHSK